MKVDLSILDRAYASNLLRRRSSECSDKANATMSASQRVEWEEEAKLAEALAIRLDNGEDLVLSHPTPITPRPNGDINYMDDPKGEKA